MARDLRTRLAGIRSTSVPRRASIPVDGKPEVFSGTPHKLIGWDQVGPHFWMREVRHSIAPVDLDQKIDGSPFSVRLEAVNLSLHGMRFFDLETTGLSGGTGTVAFLATLGRFSASDRFSTMQYFMDDYPGESSMINRLAVDLAEAEAVVSYNGASFDLPLFRTRCILNGLRPQEPRWHVDLLPVARRLWRGVLPDCSLGTIEKEILSIDRGPDLPGSAIPERWFSYLQGGKDAQEALELVFSHNDHDVRTLAMLQLMMAKGFAEGQIYRADSVGLAFLLGRSNPDIALCILEEALAQGESKVIKSLMRIYWKAGRRQERMELVPQLLDDSYGLYMKSVRAERVDRDLVAAAALADQALALATGSTAIRIENRLKRLGILVDRMKNPV